MNLLLRIMGIAFAVTIYSTVAALAAESQTERVIREGGALIKSGKFTDAVDIYSRLKTIYEQGDRSSKIALGLQYGANCYAMSHRYIDALEFYVLANKAASETNKPDVERGCLNNIGLIYAIFKDYETALGYFNKAFDKSVAANDTSLASAVLTNIINCYCYLGNVDVARRMLKLRQKYPLEKNDDNLFHSLFSNGLIAWAENDLNESAGYLRSALAMDSVTPVAQAFAAEAMIHLGFVYENLNHTDSARYFYNLAASTAIQSDNPGQLADAWRALATLYSNNGQTDSAAYYSHKWIILSDSIFNLRAFNRAKERLVNYENDLTERKFDSLENRIKEQKRAIVSILICLIFVVGLLLSIIIGRKKLRKAQKLLIDKNKELMHQNARLNQINEEYTAAMNESGKQNIPHEENESRRETFVLSPIQKENLMTSINNVMKQTEVITDPTLNINSLAKMVGSNVKYVSQTINDTYGNNFKTFLNEFRIREACTRMSDEDYMEKHTLQALASDVGFVSVNTFSVAFKKVMGMTPSVYRKLTEKNG